MKFIFTFLTILIVSVKCFSQSSVENTAVEIEYYQAYLLPQSEATNLQNALDTYGSVRLEAGDYSAAGDITMISNQKLYGNIGQRGSFIGGNITIKGGSSNIHVENYDGNNQYDIIFENTAPIVNSTFSSIYYTDLVLNNGILENNEFINISRVNTQWDCSTSGYFRNNIFKRVFQQSFDDQVTMIGNDVTPSYGNIEMSRNILTNKFNSTHYENLDNHKIIGFDAEGWANRYRETLDAGDPVDNIKPAFYFRDTGNLKLFTGNGFSINGHGEMDIEADKVLIVGKGLFSRDEFAPIIRENTDYVVLHDSGKDIVKEDNVWNFRGHRSLDNDTFLNDVELSSELTGTDASKMMDIIYDTEHIPLDKPVFEDLPDILGSDWEQERIGQLDETSVIQAMIDENNFAYLEDRVYYIGSTLIIDKNQGIIGQGTGKTAIVGLTDDFPLIHCRDFVNSNPDNSDIFSGQVTNVSYTVSNMTLQGGSDGIYVQPVGNEVTVLQVTNTAWRHLIFRNQENGIHLDAFYGLDNNFFYNLSFVNCTRGFYQNGRTIPTFEEDEESIGVTNGEWATMTYVDKVTFYRCRFINCDFGLHMRAFRASNLNSWIDCLFDSNRIPMEIGNGNSLYCANSIFTNNTGDYIHGGGSGIGWYSCDFTNNSITSVFNNSLIYAEGCNFNDNVPFYESRANRSIYLLNNNINGTFDLSDVFRGFLVNNDFTNHTELSKPMIEIANGVTTTMLDGSVDVYPQLLVKQESDNSLSIEDQFLSTTIVYPNPTDSNIIINTETENLDSYKIFDLNGRAIKSGLLNKTKTINISSLKSTVYLLQLFNKNNKIVSLKVVKK